MAAMARSSPRQPGQPLEWAALALIGAILFIRFPFVFLRHPPYLMDFEVYRATALRVLHHDAAHLYAPVYSSQALFKYAPVWAWVSAPFGWLSDHAGGVAWSTISVLCFVLTLWLGNRLCRRQGLAAWAAAPLLVPLLMARFLIEEFLNGQADALLGLLLVGALDGVSRKRWWWASAAVALAISLKLPAALLLIYFALRRAWPVAGRTVVCFLAINLAGALWLNPSNPFGVFRAWFDVLRASGADRAFEIGSQSFVALLSRFLTNDGYHLNLLALSRSTVVWIAVALQAAAVLALALRPGSRLGERRLVIDGALVAGMAVVFSPTCWLATYTLLAFPLLVAIALFCTQPHRICRDWLSAALMIATVALSWFMQKKAWWMLGIRRIGQEEYTYEVAMIAPWMALALLGFLWRQRQLFSVSRN